METGMMSYGVFPANWLERAPDMDLGRFEHSRVRFWVWITAPVVLIVAACLPSWRYLEVSRQRLTQRATLAAALAPLEVRLGTVESTMKKVVADADRGTEAVDRVTKSINHAAQLSGFTIQSLNVDKASPATEGFRVLRIAVIGQGALPAIIRWLSELQSPGLMLRVEAAKLTALSLPPDDTATAEITFAIYVRSP